MRGTPPPERLHRWIILGILALVVAGPFVVYPIVLMKVLCFALFALAFNLLLGHAGLLSFGHAAYFGMGAYVCAHLAKVGLNWPEMRLVLGPQEARWLDATVPLGLALPPFTPELAILSGAAVAGLMGLAFGALAVRREGIAFAMITLALAQMVYFLALEAPFTGGENAISGVPRGRLFGLIDLSDDRALYVLVALIFVAGLLTVHRIVHSPFGTVLRAIRANEARAVSLGYRVGRYKLLAFVLSASLAGLAGATKVFVFRLASLTDVHWTMSGEVVLMTLLGGLRTVFGPIVGAALLIALETGLAPFGAWVTILQGSVFVAGVLLFREGLVGFVARLLRRPL